MNKRSIVYSEIYLGVIRFGDKKVRFIYIYFYSVVLAPQTDGIYILVGFES